MPESYGVGIIGAGLQGRRRAQAARDVANFHLRIIADADEKAARLLADDMGCDYTTCWERVVEMKEVDVVAVCTPPHLHVAIGSAASGQGKHVLCEKPMGRCLEEAKAIVDASGENGARLKCGLNHRHHRGIRQAKLWHEQGAIGEIVFVRCRYGIGGRPGYEREWRSQPQVSGGGQLMDQGFHALDLFRWFVGDFAEVFGMLTTGFWEIAPLEDNAFALLRTAHGQVAFLHTSWTQWKNLFSFEVFGRDGYIRVEGLGDSYGVERAVLGKREFGAPFCEEVVEFRGADSSWRGEWEELAAAIREGREPLGSGQDALRAQELVHALYESAAAGRIVRLDSAGGGC
jgi:predicted dehydrogenase